jgi:hypothetical protein
MPTRSHPPKDISSPSFRESQNSKKELAKQLFFGVTFNSSKWIFGSSDGTQVWLITMAIYSTSVTRNYAVNISGAVAASKGRLVSQKTIRQSGVEGREILIDRGDSDEARERMLWISDRYYQIGFIGKTGTTSTPDVDTFLNSFQATK